MAAPDRFKSCVHCGGNLERECRAFLGSTSVSQETGYWYCTQCGIVYKLKVKE